MMSLLCMLVLIIQFTACHGIICHRGEKFFQDKICEPCDIDTYLPEQEHNHTECYPCSQVTDVLNEYVIRECSLQEDALIGSSRSNKTPCLNDTFYILVNTDGVKVCTVRTMPCKQRQFFVSGHTCAPCPPGTYMVDNHHNNTACNSCKQLLQNQEFDGYVATACNITGNSTSGSDGQDGSPVDTASFNCSHRPDVDNNATDHVCAALTERNIDKVFRILLITITVLLFVILLVFALKEHVAVESKWFLSLMKYLEDYQYALRICKCAGIVVGVVCILFTLIEQTNDLLLLMRCVAALCIGIVIIIDNLNILLFKHLSQKTSHGREHLLHNEKVPEHHNEII